jgi:hypothetical protein
MEIYYTDGTIEKRKIAPGKVIDMDEVHEIVGGYIQAVPLLRDKVLFCNEDAVSLELPPNPNVTEIVAGRVLLPPGGFLLGNAVIATIKEMGE